MKEFMKNNTVTYNLMSFTGFKSLYIFTLLLEGPKSYEELQKCLKNHPYLQESVSIDTLRIYMNSLKEIGCKIEKKTKDHITKYSISKQPFELKISKEQAKSILKVYKLISKSVSLGDYMALQAFFEKFSDYVQDEKLKEKLKNASPVSNIKSDIIKNLMRHVKNNDEITVYYNSPVSGKKNITILADKLEIMNGKLYLYGVNSEYKNYASFLVSKILKIVSVNTQKSTLRTPEITVKYELDRDNSDIELLKEEKILKKTDNKYIIEIKSKNKFDIIQRIISFGPECRVISPEEFKNEIVDVLKQMREGYFEKG